MNIKHVSAAILLALAAAPAMAADVGVSVSIGQPGFYGRIDIGDYPQPRVIYQQPVIVERRHVIEEPYYVRVPPGHRKNWKRYCGQYDACGRPVYFVDNRWYNDVYVPRYREREHGRGDHDDHGHGDDNDQGRGRGHGKGRGHGGGHGDH